MKVPIAYAGGEALEIAPEVAVGLEVVGFRGVVSHVRLADAGLREASDAALQRP